ncbi:MAG TPA: aminotransferase class V-fold PLP-dependent enzyme [Thermoanaerobaculia bacterium]|nr:aminotransferase class V-fold PLP-dependent enzyme [Thermoanaerobaculia bacterium]
MSQVSPTLPEAVTTPEPLADAEVERLRRDTPGVAERLHLNNAGAALPPRPVLDTMLDYLRREAHLGGYETEDEAAERIAAVYGDVAALLAARPENVALVENATVAFSLALSAIPFRAGDVLVTSQNDYPSNRIQYQALIERFGIEVQTAAELPAGGIDPDSVAALARNPRCRLVAVSWVPTSSGLIQDVEAVGEAAAAAGVPYLIDACQAVGQLPVDAPRLRCDYLAATARKFLRGPRGIGFLYVSDRALDRGEYPLGVDMRGAALQGSQLDLADTAKRFENWEFSYALVLGLGAAARYARAVRVERSGARAIELAAYLRRKLAELPGISLGDRGERLGAIVTAAVGGEISPRQIVETLRLSGINLHAIHAPAPGGGSRPLLRISPHYYNTREEVDAALAALAPLLARGLRG